MKKIVAVAAAALTVAACGTPVDWRAELTRAVVAENDQSICKDIDLFGGPDGARLFAMSMIRNAAGDKTLDDVADGDLDWFLGEENPEPLDEDMAAIMEHVPGDTTVMEFAGVFFTAAFSVCE